MARPPSDIRERLLHAARERFLTEGVDGASLRKIAEDAGTNIGMVYYYYKTKDDLFFAVVEEVYSVLLSDLKVALDARNAPTDRLRALYARVAQLKTHEMDVLRLMLREALVSSERLRRLATRFEQGHIPLVLQMLGDGVATQQLSGSLHPAAMLAATFSLAVMPQLAHRLVSTARPELAALLPTREETADIMCNVLLQGIGGPARPAPK